MPDARLTEMAAKARQEAADVAARRQVDRFIARAKIGRQLLKALGIDSELAAWQPFGNQEACIEVDGVFLSTGREFGGFITRNTLEFWRPQGEHGNEHIDVRSLSQLGTLIDRYGTDYRPEAAPIFPGATDA